MKKIFVTLTLLLVFVAANVTHAAKIQTLADIDTYNFFQNMGYEVDCSHWERLKGKKLFAAMIPEDPLIISKEFANIEVCAEQKKDFVLEVTLFFKAGSLGDEMSVIVNKVVKALNPEAFEANQAQIEQKIFELMSLPKMTDTIITAADNRYALEKEIQSDKVVLTIKPVAE